MKNRLAALAFATVAVLAVPALAANDTAADAMVAKIMKHLDADKDGKISRAEASGRDKLAKHFEQIDTDHDGFLSHDELTVVVQRRLDKQKTRSDF